MLSRILLCVLFANSLFAISDKRDVSQTVQGDWIAPAGPDNSTSLELGEEYHIRWTNSLWEWFGTYAPSADVSNVDLWITGFYQHQFAHMIAGQRNPLFEAIY